MERRVLVAIALSFLVLYGYQALFVPREPPPTAPASATPGSAAPAGQAAQAPQPVLPPESELADVLVGESTEREIRIETDHVAAVFTNRGAALKSWRLKRYMDQDGGPLELVPTALSSPPPFSLVVDDEALTTRLRTALFAVTQQPAGEKGTLLAYEYKDSAGVAVRKDFELGVSPYVVTVRAEVRQGDRLLEPTIEWGPAVWNGSGEVSSWVRGSGAILYRAGELQRLSPDDLAKQAVYEGDFDYAGVDDHYFLIAVVKPGPSRLHYRRVSIPPPAGSDQAARELVAWGLDGSEAPRQIFAGPKDFDVLAGLHRDLVRAIDFGMFAFIVVPLLRSLNWINGFIGNYGWSIVALTVIINALMFPLRHKSVVSMRKMQEIQPEAKAIQERYAKLKATDPAKQKMNQELMALYRERGVNPASGCVPMLLTMPVLFAFYSLLTVSIELRGAPFFGWIQDLSRPDPYFVTPVLMGASQLWQTWMTPQAGVDPAQQKMMMLMPIVFVIFSLWFPSGVALYWLVSNVWGIGQTYLTNYLIGPPTVRTVRPPAERRMKRAGAGKTEAAAREN